MANSIFIAGTHCETKILPYILLCLITVDAGCAKTTPRTPENGNLPSSCQQGDLICSYQLGGNGGKGTGYFSCNDKGQWIAGQCGWPQQCHTYTNIFGCGCWLVASLIYHFQPNLFRKSKYYILTRRH